MVGEKYTEIICPDCDHSLYIKQESFGAVYCCGNTLCAREYIEIPCGLLTGEVERLRVENDRLLKVINVESANNSTEAD